MFNTQVCYYYSVNEKSELSDYLYKCWRLFDARIDGRSTQVEFAEFLGINKVTLSHILNGRRKTPDLTTVHSIARATGDPEIYRITGYEDYIPPEPSPTELTEKLLSLPPEDLAKIMDAFNIAVSIMKETGIEINSPEGVEVLNSALHDKGLKK